MSSELEKNNNQSEADQTIDRRKLLLGTSSIGREAVRSPRHGDRLHDAPAATKPIVRKY
jgi:hypothetical protein